MKKAIYNKIKGSVKGFMPLYILAFLPLSVLAQELKTVSGYVTDAATGLPISGVLVEAYGNHKYTAMTDERGAYELKVPEYVSSVGMRVEGYQFQQKAIRHDVDKTNVELYPASFTPIYERETQSLHK